MRKLRTETKIGCGGGRIPWGEKGKERERGGRGRGSAIKANENVRMAAAVTEAA